MGTGAKIAIGCGILVVVTGLAVVGLVVGGVMWGKGKIEGIAAEQKRIEELEQKANANPFEEPADGVIQEPRLLKFLEVRRAVYPTYEKYAKQLESMQKAQNNTDKKEPDFSDIQNAFGALGGINELRSAHAQALIDAGMSQAEYRYLVAAVYKSAWAAEIQRSTGGKTAGQATEDAMKEAARALEQQAQQTPDPNLPPEAQQAFREAQEQMRRQQKELETQADRTSEAMRGVEAPAENIALFRKHEAEIKQYAMTGLEWLSL